MTQHNNAQTEQNKFDTFMQQDVMCPYCGEMAIYYFDLGSDDECNCSHCGKKLRVEVSFYFSTYKIKEETTCNCIM